MLDGTRGLLVSRFYDPIARTVRLSVAVRQSTAPPTPVSAPAELFRVSRLDLAQLEVAANPRSSTYEARAANGSLGIVSGMVTDQLNGSLRGVTTVTSTPSGGAIVWQLALSAPAVSAFSSQYTFSPDPSGNFITPDGSVIYGLSQDGKTLIGTATDPATGRTRGLVIGIR